MKLRTLALVLLSVLSFSSLAQTKNLKLNIGIPLGKYGKFDHNFSGSDVTNNPSLLIQLEKEWQDNFSIGAYIGYTGQKHEYNFGQNEAKYNYYRIGASLTYELNESLAQMNISPGADIQIYTSIKTGLSLENKKFESLQANSSLNPVYSSKNKNNLLLDLGIILGSRYYFTNQFGIFSELGWANAGFFTIGTTFTL
ncbi:outer membrane beta-barrel protein [Marinifilum sp. RC60d5]|uniref:outer membrane beta-barrel protein n=1 Tax=Marinifilum sp. RC60d5 TaxID=3458414 RepID=UPI004037169B